MFFCHGWQRATLFIVKIEAFIVLNRSKHPIEYSEQVG